MFTDPATTLVLANFLGFFAILTIAVIKVNWMDLD